MNPIAGFTRIGRQVDVAALGNRIKDTVEQVNWIYTNNRNNPWFQSRLNSNDDHRGHVTGATDFSYDIGKGATAVLRAGMDMYHESRNLQVESGWKGGYPTPLGRADFSGGGAQQEKLSVNDRVFGLAVNSGTLSRSGQLHGSVGVEVRRSEYERAMTVDDSSTLGAGSRIVTDSLEKNGMSVGALFVGASATPLTTLRARGPGITDAGVKHLAGLKALETLQLTDTGVTDKSLPALATVELATWHWGESTDRGITGPGRAVR